MSKRRASPQQWSREEKLCSDYLLKFLRDRRCPQHVTLHKLNVALAYYLRPGTGARSPRGEKYQAAELRLLYEERNMSISSIAKHFNADPRAIGKALTRFSIGTAKRKEQSLQNEILCLANSINKEARELAMNQRQECIFGFIKSGMGCKRLARQMSINEQTAKYWIKKYKSLSRTNLTNNPTRTGEVKVSNEDSKMRREGKTVRTSLGLRDALFDELDALRAGESTPQKASAISRVCTAVINSVKMETEYQRNVQTNMPGRDSARSSAILQLGSK